MGTSRNGNSSVKKSSVKKSKAPLFISIGLIAALLVAYFLVPQVETFINEAWNVLTSDDEERIQSWVGGFGWFGPVLLILAMIVQMFLLVIPTILLMVVAVLAYGPVWGSTIVFASVFAASSVGYLIGSYFGDAIVTRVIGQKSEKKVEKFLDDYGFWAIIVTRINPFLSNDAISFVGGLLRMGYWKFIGATLVGIAPLTLFIAIMGKSTESLKTGLLWGSLASLLAFGVYVWWDKGRKYSK
ncbi:TVP38/TMEM64 family protein [Pricia sp.]|uniref:TVP38/TMEM64 family protein n=1 Tax=Pricia sp. TaxID=2268138 RepID=UPI003592F523